MLRNIRIQGFRGIDEIRMEGLENINVLIGENNSGKTSVLEAIQLLKDSNVLTNLYSISALRENMMAGIRNRSSLVDSILYCFNYRQDIRINVEAEDCGCGRVFIGIRGQEERYIEETNPRGDAWEPESRHVLRGEYIYDGYGRHRVDTFEIGEGKSILRRGEEVFPIEYLNPVMIQAQHTSIKTMYNVMKSEERRELIGILRIFDSRIVGIDKAIRSGRALTFLELEDGNLMPLSTFGDGIKKVLAIANVLVKTKGGIVLIDEFETGIHKNALRKVAEWLLTAAWKNETQVFLTTHSGEALDALLEVKEYCNGINTYRLEQFNGRTYVKKFDGEKLEAYRNNRGMDIF